MGNSVKKFTGLVVLALSVLFAVQLDAQSTASLTGTITDPSGAVISGATITLVNKSTNLSYKAVSSSNGSYLIADITPGPGYAETVSRDGFQTSILTDLYLNVNATRTQNVKLLVGKVAETVSVSAANQEVPLDTTDATVGNNFQVEYINDLPIA